MSEIIPRLHFGFFTVRAADFRRILLAQHRCKKSFLALSSATVLKPRRLVEEMPTTFMEYRSVSINQLVFIAHE